MRSVVCCVVVFTQVVADCDSALSLDLRYLKGFVRRAAARLELNQTKEAMQVRRHCA